MKNSNVLLLSAGLSLAAFGVIKGVEGIQIPDPILYGLTIFTLIIGLSELAEISEKRWKNYFIFASVPFGLLGGLLVFWKDRKGEDLQNFNDAFTLIALGVLFSTFAFKDNEKETQSKKEKKTQSEKDENIT